MSDASGQASPSTAGPAPENLADIVVLSRIDNTQALETSDMRLLLSKAKREEHAIIRRLLFIAATLRLTEPSAWAGDGPAPQTCRWEYKSFLQRQQCFVSVSGVLACTQAEVIPLPETATGDAPPPATAQPGFCNDTFRPAVNARIRLASLLHDRAQELFAADQRTKVDPVFEAAGLTVVPDLPPRLQALQKPPAATAAPPTNTK